MTVKATKAGRFQNRFYQKGEIFVIPDDIFDQNQDFFSTWVEKVES